MDPKDRISNLPESVLSPILSRLPTEDAVRTSVLPRKWEYKSTSIYRVTFDDTKGYGYLLNWKRQKQHKRPRKTDFLNFVDRVLALCKNSTLKEFRLLFSEYKYDRSRMKTWITAALSANVQRLCISYKGDLLFPRSFFTSASLRKLELKLCKFRIPMNTYYSNLRTLNISGVEFQNDGSSSHLTFTLPVIEKFMSSGCKWLNVKLLRIEAPRLARFEMTGSIFECVNDGSNDCKIEICGGKLSKFKCSVDKFAKFCFSNPSRIVNACLKYSKPYSNGHDDLPLTGDIGNRACMILKKLSAFMRFLELSTDLVKVLFQSLISLSTSKCIQLGQQFSVIQH